MTNATTKRLADINEARTYIDLFGAPPDGLDALTHVKRSYRKLVQLVHPDVQDDPALQSEAERAFKRLSELYEHGRRAAEGGTYGQQAMLAVVRTRWGEHDLQDIHARGDVATLYSSESRGRGATTQSLCKVAKHAADTDLLQAEVTALKLLHAANTDTKFHAFVPTLLDSFTHQAGGRGKRQANVLERLPGFYDLTAVKAAYPKGLHALDMAWMWRRLLYMLGYVAQQEIVHGAVLPNHVMIHPEHHGLVLVDWCYASIQEDTQYPPIKAVVSSYRDWYPKEVLEKEQPTPATDIIMAARTMIYVLGGDPLTGNYPEQSTVPRPFRAFFKGCLQPELAARPQKAWELLAEFDELLQRLGSPYYPRRFHPFTMP